ncbi:MAG: type II toxin-antitoxin system RelE/ParE family toxin [Gammaproteobacteria bacterium]|jgi:putative addiction module killer protein
MLKTLKFYRTESGKIPFTRWFDKLDIQTRIRIRQRLDRLTLGQMGDHKILHQGLIELRLHFGAGYRIYFTERRNNIVLLLLGGNKSSQKRDIENAYNHMQDYRNIEE